MDGGQERGEVDVRLTKWARWIEDEIRNDILTLYHYRAIYRRVGEIVNNREPPLPPSAFLDVWQATYVSAQASAVRRQADVRRDVASLARLLTEIAARPQLLTRERFLSSWPEWDRERGEDSFTENFGQGEHFDPQGARDDLARIEIEANAIVAFVHDNVAHRAAEPRQTVPTYGDLNATIDMLGEMFKKYALLLTSSSYATLEPVIQHPWERIFEVAWIT